MVKDDDEKPPRLKVVSENPDLPSKVQREAAERAKWDREVAEQALAELAATILRTMAGSERSSLEFLRQINNFIDSHNRLRESSGSGLTLADERRVLMLRGPDFAGGDEFQARRNQIDDAFHTIVQGALRLAAHRVLGEEPHFGGMHSKRVIEAGIRELREVREQPPRKFFSKTSPPPKKASPPATSSKRPPPEPTPKQRSRLKDDPAGDKSKRWSPMDSKSWRDMKKDE